jgi:hypothetical protein
MTLSERLARAARQREGVQASTSSSRLAPPRQGLGRDKTVIVGAHVPVAAVEPDPSANADAVCPTCGRTGEVGLVDLGRQTTDWSCTACRTLWRVATHVSTS